MGKKFIWLGCIGGFALALGLYHLDTIRGRLRFNALCKTEAGPRVFGKVEKNVGWLVFEPVDGSFSYMSPLQFEHVAFVRWQNKAGEQFDVYRDPGFKNKRFPKNPKDEFIFTPADASKQVRYQYVFERIRFPDDERFGRDVEKVIDLKSGAVVASFTQFAFKWTSPDRVILNAPTEDSCSFSYEGYRDFRRSIYASERK